MKSETFESDFVFEKPMLEEAKQLQGEIGKMMEKVQRFNRRLMKRALLCSSDCFSSEFFSLNECFDCQKKCMKSLEVTDEKAQIAFGRFDSVLNGCLHSCSKQKRKSPLLSADAVICYKDCLKIGGNTLQSLDKHLTAVYTQFFN